jgi:hypothetical protein
MQLFSALKQLCFLDALHFSFAFVFAAGKPFSGKCREIQIVPFFGPNVPSG